MKRRVGGLVAAMILATVGTVVLVSYVESAKRKAVAAEAPVDVLVVAKPIAKGTPAEQLEGLVKTAQVPAKVLAADAVRDVAKLKGLVAGVDLVPGEQLVAARFVTPQTAAQLADVPKGKLLVTVALDAERALGGQLAPGQTVGVLVSFDPFETGVGEAKTPNTTHLVLHKVLVTNVQLEGDGRSGGMGGGGGKTEAKEEGVPTVAKARFLVTLALDAPAVEQVVFGAEHGFVWLTAEPAEAAEGGTKVVTRGNVYE